MCTQCRKLQKCLLMQAQTPSPLNSCVSCLSSAPLHITMDVYVLPTEHTHTNTQTLPQHISLHNFHLWFTLFSKGKIIKQNGGMAEICVDHHLYCNYTESSTHTPTQSNPNSLHMAANEEYTQIHTHKSATCVCSGWMPKWASMLRQDRSPTGSLSIYVQVSVSFLDWKNISCSYKALNCPVTPAWLDFKLYSLLL